MARVNTVRLGLASESAKRKNISALEGQGQPAPPPTHHLPGQSSASAMRAEAGLTPVISNMDMGSGFGYLYCLPHL